MPRSDRVLYFAYGSNLNRGQMRERCPGARLVGRAVLRGYAIAFCGHSARWDGAVASLERVRGSRVEGLVYRIDRADLARLDAFEGAPHVYQRVVKRIVDASDRSRLAHVYLHTRTEDYRLPGLRYFKRILREYERHGFDRAPLAAAIGAEP